MIIYCERHNNNHDFYMTDGRMDYYLFSQKYKRGVDIFYRNGVYIDKAIGHGVGKSDCSLHRTMDKLKMFVEYTEKQNGIIILEKTSRKKSKVA